MYNMVFAPYLQCHFPCINVFRICGSIRDHNAGTLPGSKDAEKQGDMQSSSEATCAGRRHPPPLNHNQRGNADLVGKSGGGSTVRKGVLFSDDDIRHFNRIGKSLAAEERQSNTSKRKSSVLPGRKLKTSNVGNNLNIYEGEKQRTVSSTALLMTPGLKNREDDKKVGTLTWKKNEHNFVKSLGFGQKSANVPLHWCKRPQYRLLPRNTGHPSLNLAAETMDI
ncbi:hypothetical protein M758_UG038900 [Ceratodon purpureus]|nr:hypothetical protein M758_UG038900 [Ceratodon purpureus]